MRYGYFLDLHSAIPRFMLKTVAGIFFGIRCWCYTNILYLILLREELYGYVPPQRVQFFRHFGLKTSVDFDHFDLKLGLVIKRTKRVNKCISYTTGSHAKPTAAA